MKTFNTREFSKFTNSKRNGGNIEYYSDTTTLKVVPDELLSKLNQNDPGLVTIQIQETGAYVICEVTGYEYFDTKKTEVKTYILTPTPVAKYLQPQYANISVHIMIRD